VFQRNAAPPQNKTELLGCGGEGRFASGKCGGNIPRIGVNWNRIVWGLLLKLSALKKTVIFSRDEVYFYH
jgi:hypothetical protein